MSITTAPTSAKTAKPTTANTNTNAAENTTTSKQYLKLAGLILGLSTILLLMLLSFVTPLLNSGAKDLPLAVGGPDMVTTKITQGLEAKSPDAFAVTNYSTAEEATEAVRNREAIGAITAGPDGITIVTASAAGTPYSTILKQIGEGLSQTGQPIHYTDVAPLTAKDPSGSAISMLALPMIFGGMSSAVAFSTVFKKSRRKQIMGAIGVAILGGLIASATLYFGFGAFEANFWPTTTVIMLGIAAISLTVLGLNSLLGFAGIGLGAVLMLFVANPLSGLATGTAWLPSPWGSTCRLGPPAPPFVPPRFSTAPPWANPSPSWCAGSWLVSGWRPPARGGLVDKLYDARRSAIRSKYRGNIGAKNMRIPASVITLGSPKP